MRKGRIYSEVRKKIILRITIVFFVLLMAATFVAIVLTSCKKKETDSLSAKGAVIWQIGYIDSESKLQDYVYSTSEEGCRCGQQPYAFNSAFLELPGIYKDSAVAIIRFYELHSKNNLIYDAYPYCLVKDWREPNKREDGYLLTARSNSVDTWKVCEKLGLTDSTGHYID